MAFQNVSRKAAKGQRPQSFSDGSDLFSLVLSLGMLLLLRSFRRGVECLKDNAAQLRSIEPAADFTALHKRNQPRLLRDDNRHRISILGHTDRRAMTCP